MFSMSAKSCTPHAIWVCGGISLPWRWKLGKMPQFRSCSLHIAVTAPQIPGLPAGVSLLPAFNASALNLTSSWSLPIRNLKNFL